MAVQSHFFGVGSLVSWAEPGVGAVATQSIIEPASGPRGLDVMRSGLSAPAALQRLLAEDSQEAVRQIAFVDRAGRVAVHTGGRCIAEAGHRIGDQVSAQANTMKRRAVWEVRGVFGGRAGSAELLRRLPAAGLFPEDPDLIAGLTRSGRMDVRVEPAASTDQAA